MASATEYSPGINLTRPRHRRGWRTSTVRQVEVCLYAVAASGLVLWEGLPLPWSLASPILVAHVVGGALAMVAVVGPFWVKHRSRLSHSRRSSMRWSGRVIELGLCALIASGVYLFLAGNRGAFDGEIAHALHLGLTFPVLGALILHSTWRWIVMSLGTSTWLQALQGHSADEDLAASEVKDDVVTCPERTA